jgi:hypothetical protein
MTADQGKTALNPVPDGSERFFAGAYGRMARLMAILTVLTTPVLTIELGKRFAFGFLVGAAVAALNFYWMKSAVSSLGDVVTQTGQTSTAGIVAKSLLRYALLAVIVYGIFRGSGQVVYGFFAGLFVPVAAMVCEAAYEAWAAMRHDI